MRDIRQSPNYAEYLKKIGWQTEKIEGNYIFIKKMPILGNFIKIQRPQKIDLKAIEKLAKKAKAFQVVLEPNLPLLSASQQKQILSAGFRESKSPYLPSKTLEINLTQSKEKIYNKLKKDARYALRKTQAVKINSTRNLDVFRKVWKKSVPPTRYTTPTSHLKALQKAFGKDALFLMDENQNAGAIFLAAAQKAYYWQAFTNPTGRKQNLQYRIVWEGILWAKKKGVKVFDFEGIYDSRFPNHKWKGFTHFKKSFGGKETVYPKPYSKTYWKKFWKFG